MHHADFLIHAHIGVMLKNVGTVDNKDNNQNTIWRKKSAGAQQLQEEYNGE
jgi:hypothetical protein